MGDLLQDLRYAFRNLSKNPAFTLTSLAALALGIGANTLVFSVVYGLLLRPLPFPDPGQLVILSRTYRGQSSPIPAVSHEKFLFWRDNNQAMEAVAAQDLRGSGYNLTGRGDPERIEGLQVTGDYFRVFGVQPSLGRIFTAEELRTGGPKAVILSDRLWRRRFNANPSIVGTKLALSGEMYTIAGVMPATFGTLPRADLLAPMRPVFDPNNRANSVLVIGRMKPRVTVDQAQAEMVRVARLFRNQYGNLMSPEESAAVNGYQDFLIAQAKPALWTLLAAVGFVLLIACANVANLTLVRAAGRSREMAVRLALGAGAWRLIRQLLTESAVLALAGGALGLGIAYAGLPVIRSVIPSEFSDLANLQLDAQVMLFCLGASLLTSVLTGLLPAMEGARVNLAGSMKEGGSRGNSSARGNWLRAALVVGEVALSLVLLIGASLLIRTFANLRDVDPGFDPSNVIAMQMSMTGPGFETTAASANLFRRVIARLESLPGVESAAVVTNLPLELGPDLPYEVEGKPELGGEDAQYRYASPNYLKVMRIPLRQGRWIDERDSASGEPVVVINESLARRAFKNENALGQRITIGRHIGPVFADRTRRVIGVVGDVRESGLDSNAPEMVYIPADQVPDGMTRLANALLPISWVVRTRGQSGELAETLRREVLAVSATQPVSNVRPLDNVLTNWLSGKRFQMILLGGFALLALLLAAVGIYGVVAFSANQRRREIGIRMALGAQASNAAGLVVKQGVRLAGIGVAIGLAISIALSTLVKSLLYGVPHMDPLTYAVGAATLFAIAVGASIIPGYRASRVDPVRTLREE